MQREEVCEGDPLALGEGLPGGKVAWLRLALEEERRGLHQREVAGPVDPDVSGLDVVEELVERGRPERGTRRGGGKDDVPPAAPRVVEAAGVACESGDDVDREVEDGQVEAAPPDVVAREGERGLHVAHDLRDERAGDETVHVRRQSAAGRLGPVGRVRRREAPAPLVLLHERLD